MADEKRDKGLYFLSNYDRQHGALLKELERIITSDVSTVPVACDKCPRPNHHWIVLEALGLEVFENGREEGEQMRDWEGGSQSLCDSFFFTQQELGVRGDGVNPRWPCSYLSEHTMVNTQSVVGKAGEARSLVSKGS